MLLGLNDDFLNILTDLCKLSYLKTIYFLTMNSGHKSFDNIQQVDTFKTKIHFLHFERNWNKLFSLKQLSLLDIALAIEHLEVHSALAVLVGGSNDVQVRRIDDHPVDDVFEGLLHSHLLHSHDHVTGHVVCQTLWLVTNYRCDIHVTRAIHLVFNGSSDDRSFALRARDVRLVR